MAQTGYTPILLYASGTSTNVPLAANLTSSASGAELALNYADGKLFYKDGGGVVQVLASKASASNTFQTSLSGLTPSTATTGAVTLAGTLGVPSGGTGLTTLTSGYIPYGNGTGALSSSSSLNYSGTLLSATNIAATGAITSSASTGAFSYGTLSGSSADTGIFASYTLTTNSYGQIILQNTSTGTAASVDYVVNNNNSTATTYYGDYGMNGSGWTGTAGTNSFNAPNMVYLTSTTVDLLVGTTTANTVRFATNGGADAMQINGTTSIVSFPTTGAITLPNGTTGQQPASPASGMLRFNTTTTQFEGYNGTTWASVGGAAISNDTSTGSFEYPLFASATSGTALTIYTSNNKYLYKPSTGELQASELIAGNGLILNNTTVASSYTIQTGNNAMSVGPVTIATGQSVTVSSGQRWLVF